MEKTGNDKDVKGQSVRVKADESMKILFNLSKRPTLDLLNALFGEQFRPEETEVIHQNTEFVPRDPNSIYGDSLIQVTEQGASKHFHVEFQTYDSSAMIIRMFEYGFHIAKESIQKDHNRKIVMRYPKQLVLYLERDDTIEEEISCLVQFPPYTEESQYEYKVPVKKFWNISAEEMRERMYALVPFHAFTSRKRIMDIENDKGLTAEQKEQMIHQELAAVKAMIASSQTFLLDAFGAGKITDEDLDKMNVVMLNLSHHLYEKFYRYYQTFYEEVEQMVTSVLNYEALRKGRLEAHRKGLQKGLEKTQGAVLRVLQARGIDSEEWASKVQAERDFDTLTRWLEISAIGTVDQILEEIGKEK